MNEVVEFVFFVNGIWFVKVDVKAFVGWCIVRLGIVESLRMIEICGSMHERQMNKNLPRIILLADH